MAVESHDKKLDDLLKMVEDGKAQLPDFQRSWVWDDTKICKLIESITSGFPMGAAMFWLMVVSKSDSAIGSLKA